jgi:hypothetical protein
VAEGEEVPALLRDPLYLRSQEPQKCYTTFLEYGVRAMGSAGRIRKGFFVNIRVDEDRYSGPPLFQKLPASSLFALDLKSSYISCTVSLGLLTGLHRVEYDISNGNGQAAVFARWLEEASETIRHVILESA